MNMLNNTSFAGSMSTGFIVLGLLVARVGAAGVVRTGADVAGVK